MTCNTQPSSIVTRPLNVINLGVDSFADPLAFAQVPVENCAWQPPAEGDAELGWNLAELLNNPEIDAANEVALIALYGGESGTHRGRNSRTDHPRF